jgi:hypothetical protein
LLAHEGEYGVVTAVSRASGVSRQSLYAWRERGRAALSAAFAPPPPGPAAARGILTLLVSGHASYRGIQVCLRELAGRDVSLGAIAGVVAAAGRRAQTLLGSLRPPEPAVLAVDEFFGHAPQAAVLSAVDARSGVVWGIAGPAVPDTDSWTLLLWELAARGMEWTAAVHDGGKAAAGACAAVAPDRPRQRDVWHALHRCAQAQVRLDRQTARAAARWEAAERYQAAVAAGGRPRYRPPRSVPEAVAAVDASERAASALRYLTAELRRLLAVVVLERGRVRDRASRQADLEAVLALLADLAETAPAPVQTELGGLHRHLTAALPGLLSFTAAVEPIQQAATAALGPAGVGLVGWAWEHRAILDPAGDTLLTQLPVAWRAAAGTLVAAWHGAVRASSAVEGWYSLLRAHAAVHRTLSPWLLALLAVWHNHRVYARGAHAGRSPLRRSGVDSAPTDWLTALGYPPAAPPAPPRPVPLTTEVRLAA